MKRTLSILMILAIFLCLCSCGTKTPSTEIALQKEEANIDDQPSDAEGLGTARINDEFTTENGLIQVSIHDDAVSPLPKTMPVLRVSPKTVSVQTVQHVANVLFGDTPLYEYSEELSRAEILEMISALEQGVTDTAIRASYGGNASDAIIESVRQGRLELLEYYRNAYANAREDIQPVTCQWKFWPMEHYVFYDYGGVDASYTDDIPYGVSVDLRATTTANGIPYQLWASNYERADFRNHSIRVFVNEPSDLGGTGSEEMAQWIKGLGVFSTQPATEQELETAKAKAGQMLSELGLGDWQIEAKSQESVFYKDQWQISIEARPIYAGFTGLKLDKTTAFNDSTFSEQDYYYESVQMSFRNDGTLISFEYKGPVEIVEVTDESAALLASGQIQEIVSGIIHGWEYSGLFQYSNEGGMDLFGPVEIDSCHVAISSIELGYVRKQLDKSDFLLIPALSFRGEVEVIGKPQGLDIAPFNLMDIDNAGEHALLTINLLDGSVV